MLPSWCRFCDASCTNCKPGSILVDIDGGIAYVVVRRLRGCEYLAIAKYRRSDKGLHVYPVIGTAERLLFSYDAASVASAARLTEDPSYGVSIPLANPCKGRWICCSPEPEASARLLPELASLAEAGCAYLTGSLAAGAWIEGLSDVDVIVDVGPGCAPLLDAVRELGELHGLRGEERRRWLEAEAAVRGLSLEDVDSVVPLWQRMRIGGLVYSVAPLDVAARMGDERRVFKGTGARARLGFCIEPLSPGLGDYPAIVLLDGDGCLVVYDGFLVPGLLEGGCFEAEGWVVELVEGEKGRRCIAVGGREGNWRLKRLRRVLGAPSL